MTVTKEQAHIIFRDGEENIITVNGDFIEIQADSNICVDGWSMNFIEANTFFLEIGDFIEVMEGLR